MVLKKLDGNLNIIKTRDDSKPLQFETAGDNKFKFIKDTNCPWYTKKDPFGTSELRKRIEPWLTALFQSEHLSLLVGSGLMQAIGGIAQCVDMPGMGKDKFEIFDDSITLASESTAKSMGRDVSNFEDQIRVANELLVGLSHFCQESDISKTDLPAKVTTLKNSISTKLGIFANSILEGERKIKESSEREKGFEYLINFLLSPASRAGTRDRLQIFTTNYDRLLEAGAEIAGIHLVDRFVGNLSPIFRSSRLDIDMHYNPPGIRGEPRFLEGVAKFTKLHGSIDWINEGRDIRRIGLPFGATGIEPFLAKGISPLSMMIYPNSSKDRETASYPYVDLFRDFATSICRPNNTLITFGYGFGDEHINRVIEDMLTIPSTHLVIISYSDPSGRIMLTYEKIGRPAQISLLLGNHLGDLKTIVDQYIPKPAIDKTTYKMNELLRSRLGAFSETDNGKESDSK